MRPKIAIGILLLGTALLLVIVLASKTVHPQSPVSPAVSEVVSAAPTNSVNVVKALAVSLPPVFSAVPVADTNAATVHAQYVRERIKELNVLAMNNDMQSRDTILSEVKNNPDRQIRAAALEAAIQFDDRSVVPPLQTIAAQTEDPEEKQNILDAIDYINLPSFSDYLAANPSHSTTPGVRMFPHKTHPAQSPNANPPNAGQ